jgi:predicted DCC family thiol-disulfide oxidoreductase YuxK
MALDVEHRAPPTRPDPPAGGWVLYDGDCGFCRRWAKRVQPHAARRGFVIEPLQAPWVAAHFNDMTHAERVSTIRLLHVDGRHLHSGDAWIAISRWVWWLWPVHVAGRLPVCRGVVRAVYRWVARRRGLLGRVM